MEYRNDRPVSDRSPLDDAEHLFQLLAGGPNGLVIQGTLADDLPQRPIPLNELRSVLTHPLVSKATRDLVWRELVGKARAGGPRWLVGTIGVALPKLRAVAERINRGAAGQYAVGVEGQVLVGFIEAVRSVNLHQPKVGWRLFEAAESAGCRARDAEMVADATLCSPPRWEGSTVLFDAVAACLSGDNQHGDISPHETSARSRVSSDTRSVLDQPKGGRGATPGSARDLPWMPLRRQSSATSTRRPEDAPGLGKVVPVETAAGRQRRPAGHGKWKSRFRHAVVMAAIMAAVIAAIAAAAITGAFGESGAWAAPPTSPDQLEGVFTNLRNWLIGLLATLATLMLTLGGLRYLIAGGDPGEVQKAKVALRAAAYGYALAVLAPLLVNVLKRVIGG